MSSRSLLLRLSALAGALALGACQSLLGAGTVAEPALIIFYGDTSRIAAPDSVSQGATFTVRFRTFAGGCTREVARTEVRVTGPTVEIRPYNLRQEADACTSDLLFLTHEATVRLTAPGVATIRVLGEQRGGTSGARNAPAELTRTVVVR